MSFCQKKTWLSVKKIMAFCQKKSVFLSKKIMSFCQKKTCLSVKIPPPFFINTTAVAVISEAVFANAKNVCDREKICFCRK